METACLLKYLCSLLSLSFQTSCSLLLCTGAPLLPSPGQQSPKAAFDVGTSEQPAPPPALLPNYRKRLHACRDHETMRKGLVPQAVVLLLISGPRREVN